MIKVGEFYAPGKIIFGSGGLSRVGTEAKRLGNKVLVVLGRSAMRKSRGNGIEKCLLINNCRRFISKDMDLLILGHSEYKIWLLGKPD